MVNGCNYPRSGDRAGYMMGVLASSTFFVANFHHFIANQGALACEASAEATLQKSGACFSECKERIPVKRACKL